MENLTLLGTANIDATGNILNNVLIGNASVNTLNGGAGNDTLTGGAGFDRFLFDSALNATTNKDIITDFDVAGDNLSLENSIFTKLTTPGVLAAGNFVFGAGAIASDINDYLIYDTTDGSLYYDADGNDAIARVEFVSLTGIPTLTAANFAII
jgi:Ca2+-binding RTX toxin-like protein